MPLKIVFFEASKWVSTKTLLLKHYYRRQGSPQKHRSLPCSLLKTPGKQPIEKRPVKRFLTLICVNGRGRFVG